jgi:hypothetical protein
MCVSDTMATKDRPSDPRSNWTALSQAERDAAYDNNAAVTCADFEFDPSGKFDFRIHNTSQLAASLARGHPQAMAG